MKAHTKVLALSISLLFLFSCEKGNNTMIENKAKTYLEDANFNMNGIVAYYPLNGDVKDYSGNGIHGNANNVEYSQDRFDKLNGACVLKGESSYIEISNASVLNNDTYTICFWYRSDLSDTLKHTLFTKSDSIGNGYTFTIQNRNNFSNIRFHYKNILSGSSGWKSLDPSSRSWSSSQEQEFDFTAISFSKLEFFDYIGGVYTRGIENTFNENNFDLFIGKSVCLDLTNYNG